MMCVLLMTTEDYWKQYLNTLVPNTWPGLVYMAHINQIRHAHGLDQVAVEYYSWRSNNAPRV